MDVEELKERISGDLRTLAEWTGAKAHVWMLVDKEGGTSGACSHSLKDFEWTLKEVVRSAAGVCFEVINNSPRGLREAECLKDLVKTKHVELHPILAVLINGLNEINGHKIPRSKAQENPDTVPLWFPRLPNFAKLYAERVQNMKLNQLFPVMDAIFDHVRTWELDKVRTLSTMLFRNSYRPLVDSVGNWAGLKCYFDVLEAEAAERERRDGGAGPGFGAAAELVGPRGDAGALQDPKGERDIGGVVETVELPAAGNKKRARKEAPRALQVPPIGGPDATRGGKSEVRTPSQANEESWAQRSGLTDSVSAGQRSPGTEVHSRGFEEPVTVGASGGQPAGPAHPPGPESAPSLDVIWGPGTAELFRMDVDEGEGKQALPGAQLQAETDTGRLPRLDSFVVLPNILDKVPLPKTLDEPAMDDFDGFDLGEPVWAVGSDEPQRLEEEELRRLVLVHNVAPAAFDAGPYTPGAGVLFIDEQTRPPPSNLQPQRDELPDAPAPFLAPRAAPPADQTGLQPLTLEQRLRGLAAAPPPRRSRGSAPSRPDSAEPVPEASTPSPTLQRSNARNSRHGLAPPVEPRTRQPGRRAAPSLSPTTSLDKREPGAAPPKRGILVPAGFRIPRLLELLSPKREPLSGSDREKEGVHFDAEPGPTHNRAHTAPPELLQPRQLGGRSPRTGPHRRRASTGMGTIPSPTGASTGDQERSEPFPLPRSPVPRPPSDHDEQKEGVKFSLEPVPRQKYAHSAPAGSELLQPKPEFRPPLGGSQPYQRFTKMGPIPFPGAESGEERSEPFPVPRSPVLSPRMKAEPSMDGAEADTEAYESFSVRRQLSQEQELRPGSVNAPGADRDVIADGVKGGAQGGGTNGVGNRQSLGVFPRGRIPTLSTTESQDGVKAGVRTALEVSDGTSVSVPAAPVIRSVPLVSRADGTAGLVAAGSSDGADAAPERPDPVANGTDGSPDRTDTESDRTDGSSDGTDVGTDDQSVDGEESLGDSSDTADGAEVAEETVYADGEASHEAIEVSDDTDSLAAAHRATGEREAHANKPNGAAELGAFPRASHAADGREHSDAAKKAHRAGVAAGRDKARVSKPGPRANGFVPGIPEAAAAGIPLGGTLEARIVQKEQRAAQLDAVIAVLEERMAALWTSASALSRAIGPAESDGWESPSSVLAGHPTARSATPVVMRSSLGNT